MHRPLFLIGFSSLWSMLLVSLVSDGAAVIMLIASAILFLLTVAVKSTRREKLFPVVFASVTVISALFLLKTYFVYYPVAGLCGKTYTITGRVVEVSGKNSSDSYVCTVSVEKIEESGTERTNTKPTDTKSTNRKTADTKSANSKITNSKSADRKTTDTKSTDRKTAGTESAERKTIGTESEIGKLPRSFKVRLTSKTYEGRINDRVSFKGKLSIPGDFLKEKDPRAAAGMKNYYKSKDIFVMTTAFSGVSVLEKQDDLKVGLSDKIPELVYKIRNHVKETAKRYIAGRYAGILNGMLIGDKFEIDDGIYENFKAVGVVHLLSVSGFHCSLWGMLIYRGLLRSGASKRLSSCAVILFLLAFAVVTGLSRSTVRASLMLTVFFVGRIFTRDSDSINSLGLAALLVVFGNPFACGDTGFLLSFFSTLGIFLFYPTMKKTVRPFTRKKIHNFYVRQRVNTLSDIILISLCTFVLNFPLVVLFLGDVSLISPLANLLVSPIASLAIFLTGIGVLLDLVPGINIFASPVFLVAGVSARFIDFVTEKLSHIPYSSVAADDGATVLIVCFVLLIIAFSLLSEKIRPRVTAFVALAFFCACEVISILFRAF